MSAYLHLFVRKNNEFVPIATYGRSTQIYKVFGPYAPWEKIAPISVQALADIGESLHEARELYASEIDKATRRIEYLATTNDSIEKAREFAQGLIAELESEIDEIDDALHFISFLSNIQSELNKMYDCTDLSYRSEDGIYAGIECGRVVSVSDIATSRAVEEEK